ncbi:MAG TPA: DedA family protein [Ktedonobacterales bacterium]
MDLLRQLAQWALLTFDHHQLALLFVLLAIEEGGIPIPVPGDTFVLLAGDQAHHLGPHSLAVLAASTAAVFVGSSALFTVVRWGGRPLVDRYGKYLRIRPERLAWLERGFARRGTTIMVVGRLIPGLRIITTVVAGLSAMSYRRFAFSVTLAGAIWATLWYLLGMVAGHQVTLLIAILSDVVATIPPALLALLLLILAGALVLGALFARRVRRVRRAAALSRGA